MKLIVDIDENLYTRLFDNGDNEIDDMAEALAVLRKGTPAPKGKWIPKGRWHIDPQCIEYTCSICGRRIMSEERLNVIEQYPFCHCGADMRR